MILPSKCVVADKYQNGDKRFLSQIYTGIGL
jgi:hypothetical protein